LTYDPAIHHRRSIRLKGHDYAGGGEYFVTICAHRDWIAQEQGRPFHAPGLRELIGRVWESLPDRFPEMGAVGAGLMPSTMSAPMAEKSRHETGTHEGSPYVIMPDHFHGLIALPRGVALGDAMGAFKSLVVRGVVAGVKREEFPPFPGKIWHRNYYEKIVRSEMERAAIEKYIRLNPVRLEFRLERHGGVRQPQSMGDEENRGAGKWERCAGNGAGAEGGLGVAFGFSLCRRGGGA
jgi:putative transposase